MSTRSLGSLTLDLIAKVGGFTSGMDQAARTAQDRMRKISQVTARATAAIGLSLSGVGVAAVAMAKSFVDSATQIENLSKLAGSNTEVFQRWAAGASTVGISQEKLADILKDTQDKIGDFVQTGGGAMADFFERVAPKVGVTAEQFRKLSGPQALQLYVKSLEKANLSQSDFTFFMEAIASDSTALLPLLRNNGEQMDILGDKAVALGAVMDSDMLEAAKRAREEFAELDLIKKGLGNRIMADLLPTLTNLTSKLTDTKDGADLLATAATAAATGVKLLTSVGIVIAGVFKTVGEAIGGVAFQIVQLVQGNFAEVDRAGVDIMKNLTENVTGTFNAVKAVWDEPIVDPKAVKEDAEEAAGTLSPPFQKATKQVRDQVADMMASIRRELETFGMNDIELKLFDLKGKGASDEILKEAESILKRVDALKREKEQREEVEEARKREVEGLLDWKRGIEATLADYAFEYELLKMTNDEREIAIALRYANAEAASEEGKMIVEAIRKNQEFAKEQQDTIDSLDAVRGAGKDFFADFASGAKSFKDSMMDALDSLRNRLVQLASEKLMDQILGTSGSSDGGQLGQAISSFFGSFFKGGRAGGGSVTPGSMYRVNETGMEMVSVGGRDYLMTGSQSGIVSAAGGDGKSLRVQPKVEINIENQTGASMDTSNQSVNFDGEKWVVNIVAKAIGSGRLDRTMGSAFGVRRQGYSGG